MQVSCTQCGASLPLAEDDRFLTCDFCSSSMFVDGGRGRGSFYVAPLLDETTVRPAVADVVGTDPILSLRRQLIPFMERRDDKHTTVAPATDVPVDLGALRTLPGERHAYTSTVLGDWERLAPAATGDGTDEDGAALLHYPLYRVDYLVGEREYLLYVDAVSGTLLADELPTRVEGSANRAFLGTLALSFCIYVAVFHGVATSLAVRCLLLVPCFLVLTFVTARVVARRP